MATSTASLTKRDRSEESTVALAYLPLTRPPVRAVLTRLVEEEVIPRLVQARRASLAGRPATLGMGTVVVDEFATLVLAHADGAAASYVAAMRAQGLSMEALCLDLLIPTARYLRHLWDEDRHDFATITIGLCRLQLLVRTLDRDLPDQGGAAVRGHSVLLVAGPSCWPTVELAVVEEFFRRAGWAVRHAGTDGALADLVHSTWCDVACLWPESQGSLAAWVWRIRTMRRASRNQRLGVLAGGPVLGRDPARVRRVGVRVAGDASQAVPQAHGLLAAGSRLGETCTGRGKNLGRNAAS